MPARPSPLASSPARSFAARSFAALALAAAALALLARPAPAQERRLDAHPGGTVALAASAFAWTEPEARAFVGAAKGERVVIALEADAPDPLAASALPARRFTLDSTAERVGDLTEPAQSLANAAAVELVGGTWIAWWRVLMPNGKTSRLALELSEAHRRGVPVLGAGAAAGFLAAAVPVARAELGRPERNPHRADPDAAFGGLGLVALVLDADALAHPSLDRGLRALLRGGATSAVHLAGDAAWIVDEREQRARLLGRDGAFALFVDVSHARRMRESLREGRLTRVEPGEEWDFARAVPVVERARWTPPREPPTLAAEKADDPLATARLGTALAKGSALVALELVSERCTLRLACDADTRGGKDAPYADVLFDVAWEFPGAGR